MSDEELKQKLAEAIERCDIVIRGDCTHEQLRVLRAAFPGRSIGVTGTLHLPGVSMTGRGGASG